MTLSAMNEQSATTLRTRLSTLVDPDKVFRPPSNVSGTAICARCALGQLSSIASGRGYSATEPKLGQMQGRDPVLGVEADSFRQGPVCCLDLSQLDQSYPEPGLRV